MALSDEVKADYQRYQEEQVVLQEIANQLKAFKERTDPIVKQINEERMQLVEKHTEQKYKVGQAYKTYKQGYDLEMADDFNQSGKE